MSQYFWAFAVALGLSAGLTPLVRRLAFRIGAVDKPDARKVHVAPVPRIGGLAIVLAFLAVFLYYVPLTRPFLAMLGAILILLTVGLYDDIKGLRAQAKLFWQIVAACVALAGGIGIIYVTNPLGGVINLGTWDIPISLGPLAFDIRPLANLASIIWMVGMINTVNFLDGLDGLVTGVSAIAALVLFITALTPAFANPIVALLSIALLGALLGFLPYNFFPSSIFMGDSGAYVIGLLLALLSIYANSSIAVGSLVLIIAIVDAVWTVLRRLLRGQSPFKADRSHLHHQLLDSGQLSHRQVVLLLYGLTILIAVVLLLVNGPAAIILLLLLLVIGVSLTRLVNARAKR